jgi:hypothetical protein
MWFRSGTECSNEVIQYERGFRLTAEGAVNSAIRSALLDIAWRCVEIIWCWYYSRQQCLKPEYMTYNRMRADVSYFWINVKYRSITVHYKRNSHLYKMCVIEQVSDNVMARGGVHSSNGHHAMFCFNQGGACFVRCFDEECREKCTSFLGRELFTVAKQDCLHAHRVFNMITL